MARISEITFVDVSASLSIAIQLEISITGARCLVVVSFVANVVTAMTIKTRGYRRTLSPVCGIGLEELVT